MSINTWIFPPFHSVVSVFLNNHFINLWQNDDMFFGNRETGMSMVLECCQQEKIIHNAEQTSLSSMLECI